MAINGNDGNDDLAGTNSADIFNLSQGGEDRAHGFGGNDTVVMGAAFDAGDQIDGGIGNDTVRLSGDYSGFSQVTFTATTMVNVETLVFGAGHDYSLVTNDATVAAGKTLTVDASTLGAARGLDFDGSAETDGNFHFIGGAGDDRLTGGAGNDVFDLSRGGNDFVSDNGGANTYLLGGALTRRDEIAGNASDTAVFDGDYSRGYVFGINTLLNVGTYVFAAGHTYDLTVNEGAHTIDASALGASDSLRYDASTALGDIHLLAGRGVDRIHTGGGNDTFDMGANLTAADRINGGGGFGDTLLLNGDYTGTHAVTLGPNTLVNVESARVAGGHSYDLAFDPENFDPGVEFIFDARALHKTDTLHLTVDFSAFIFVYGGGGNDTIIGSAPAPATPFPTVDLSQGGNDTIVDAGFVVMGATLTAADSITHGAVEIVGDYTGAHKLVFGPQTFKDVNLLRLGAGHQYSITMNDGNLSAGHVLTIDHDVFDPGDRLIFNGAAETDGSFNIIDTTGDDILTGGAQADTFQVVLGGNDTVHAGGGNDTIESIAASMMAGTYLYDGGTGTDTLVLGFGDQTETFTDKLKSIETIQVTNAYKYVLTAIDANVAAGETMTVDASGLTFSGTLTFDGSAETNGNFHIAGGLNPDALTAGAGDDILQGGLSADALVSGAGNDIFKYTAVAESTSVAHDSAMDFDPAHDLFDLNVHVKATDSTILGQLFNSSAFDDQLEAQVNSGLLAAHHAVLFTSTGGDIMGTFLIVDANGVAGYQTAEDYVIQVNLTAINKGLFI